MLGGVWILACGAFVPAGSCAKGCGACARSSDDVVRATSRAAPRYVDDIARVPGRAARQIEGSIGHIARSPSTHGAAVLLDDAARPFGRDYARAVERANISKAQHDHLLDAFDVVQTALDLAPDDHDGPAADLDARIARILDEQQRRQLHASMGTSRQIVERIARERPVQKSGKP